MIQRFTTSISSLGAWVGAWAWVWAVGFGMAVVGSPAFAQAEKLSPPKTTETPSSPKYFIMAIVLVLVAAAVVVATLKAKRGHQD